MTPSLFALVDCNNFYASCERMFRPDLVGKPIVVLSNNDGCVVARSVEAKQLGIKMTVPVYQIANQLRQHQVAVFSSNYALTVGNFFRCYMLEFFMINKLDEEKRGRYSFTVCLDILKK
ncbi:DNA repair nucleotidyltransferase [Shewanella sp. NKUCC06_TVS]|nr:DNA repair nucleotidyltransferase [Shewanella sp. NKUCC06_TVS]